MTDITESRMSVVIDSPRGNKSAWTATTNGSTMCPTLCFATRLTEKVLELVYLRSECQNDDIYNIDCG